MRSDAEQTARAQMHMLVLRCQRKARAFDGQPQALQAARKIIDLNRNLDKMNHNIKLAAERRRRQQENKE